MNKSKAKKYSNKFNKIAGAKFNVSLSHLLETLQIQRERLEEKLKTEIAISLERDALVELKKLSQGQSIVFITGIRRCGKSTLLSQLATSLNNQSYYYINFEDERFARFALEDFTTLEQALLQLFGKREIFLIDEIQNIPEWERWVRRLHDEGRKLIITGSNASLLSSELGTKLTGRYRELELFPFSFLEFLRFKKNPIDLNKNLQPQDKAIIIPLFDSFLRHGGFPANLNVHDGDYLKLLYQDIIYRDIVARYGVKSVVTIRELGNYLASNVARLLSYNKLLSPLSVKGVTTIKNYVSYFEASWLFFVISRASRSVKQQQLNPKKIYIIDTGIADEVGYAEHDRSGFYLENLVFLELRRIYQEIFYYQTKNGEEVDIYIPREKLFVQVCYSLTNEETKNREVKTLLNALKERPNSKGIIITHSEEYEIKIGSTIIPVKPLYKVLLRGQL
jgi:hypothetical protein